MKISTPDKKNGTAAKFLSYSGMASAFLAVAPEAGAQIIYTDVDPDAVLTNDEHAVDFDGDGVVDLTIEHSSFSFSSFFSRMANVSLPDGNAMMGTQSGSYMYPAIVALDAPIGPAAANWQTAASGTLGVVYPSSSYGNWLNGQEGFVGVRFVIGDETYYGWVELEVADGSDNVTVRGYAYESTPDMPIDAGARGPVGILTPDPLTAFAIAPNPTQDRCTITFTARETGTVQLGLLNSIGQLMQDRQVRVATGVNTVELPMDGIAPGSYFLHFQSAEFAGFRQVTKR